MIIGCVSVFARVGLCERVGDVVMVRSCESSVWVFEGWVGWEMWKCAN